MVIYAQWRKSWGTGRDRPSQSFDWGTALLTVSPKFKLRRDSAGSCFVRSHKEHITFYNFEAVIVKFQFPLYTCSMTVVNLGGPGPPHYSIFKKCNFF